MATLEESLESLRSKHKLLETEDNSYSERVIILISDLYRLEE